MKQKRYKSIYTESRHDLGVEEEDIFVSDSGTLGANYSVSQGGDFLGEFKSEKEVNRFIAKWTQKNNYYPSVWYQDDHGGISSW